MYISQEEDKRNALFVNLMYEMSKFLNFNHTKLDREIKYFIEILNF